MKCVVSLTSNSSIRSAIWWVVLHKRKKSLKALKSCFQAVRHGPDRFMSVYQHFGFHYLKKTASWVVLFSLLFCLQWLWLTTYPGLNLRAGRTPTKARMWWVLKCQLLTNCLQAPANFWCFMSIIYPPRPPTLSVQPQVDAVAEHSPPAASAATNGSSNNAADSEGSTAPRAPMSSAERPTKVSYKEDSNPQPVVNGLS